MGRYGPMVQMGDVNDEEKPHFAKLKTRKASKPFLSMKRWNFLSYRETSGQFENNDVSVNIGRFGPYIAHDGKFYSLGKDRDPYTITLDEATPIVIEKRAAKEERTIKVFEKEKIQLLRGPIRTLHQTGPA